MKIPKEIINKKQKKKQEGFSIRHFKTALKKKMKKRKRTTSIIVSKTNARLSGNWTMGGRGGTGDCGVNLEQCSKRSTEIKPLEQSPKQKVSPNGLPQLTKTKPFFLSINQTIGLNGGEEQKKSLPKDTKKRYSVKKKLPAVSTCPGQFPTLKWKPVLSNGPAAELTNSTNRSVDVPMIEYGNLPIPQKVPITGAVSFVPS